MTNLTGSPKQIEWAAKIVAKCELSSPAAISLIAAENSPAVVEIAKDALAQILSNSAAGWWIDNRYSVSTASELATTINETLCGDPALVARLQAAL